jgi:glycosyl transferase family 25
MADHLGDFGISPEVSAAVFITSNHEDLPEYDGRRRLQELGYHLTKGEVGCFLAHRDAWKKVVAAGVPCLILEDDARLDAALVAHLESAAQAIAGSTMMVRLFSMKTGRHKRWKELSAEFSLVRPLAAASSAVAYLISPACAAALLGHSSKFWLAVDEFMDDEADHGCVVLQGYPQLVRHDDEGASMVGGRKKPPLSLGRKILREIARVRRNISQALNRERTLWRLGLRP